MPIIIIIISVIEALMKHEYKPNRSGGNNY